MKKPRVNEYYFVYVYLKNKMYSEEARFFWKIRTTYILVDGYCFL